MKLLLIATLALLPLTMNAKNNRFYELRTYTVAPAKMDALNNRFREHTLHLFRRHEIESIGYWTQLDNEGKPTNRLTFLLRYPSREAREKSWREFMADPDWQAAVKTSEATGKLVEKVENPYLVPTDYSPAIKPGKNKPPRVFELRTYHTTPGNLDNLHARFRNYTIKLFEKHGMTNFGYFTPADEKDGAGNTLIYILAHKDRDAAAASFKAFRDDPDWVAVRKASEEKAGGSLTTKVDSIFMKPTDYSPTQ